MKNKKILLSILGVISFVIAAFAADNLGNFSDATKTIYGYRWQLFSVGTTSSVATSTANYTNVVLATPGIVGKVIWTPGAVGDQFELHTAATAATASTANLIFIDTSTTNTTTGPVVGYPQIFDLASGDTALNATNGIVCIVKPGTTASVARVTIVYDQNR